MSQPTDYLEIEYLRDEVLAAVVPCPDFVDTVTVDTSLSSFVRVEVRDVVGGDLVYSNPIHFVRSVPARGVAAERVGVRAGEIRVFLADSFRLTSSVLESGTGDLIVTGDEDGVGLGSLWLDPGALGPPAAVPGADDWSYVGGIVQATGFSGLGSTVRFTWVPTDAPEHVGSSGLRLGPGRPNPFGDGTVVDYALPAAGWVRVEILDVTGRRVRVLELGFREAGVRRVSWDGSDEFGRETAAGVYWVRLEYDGDALVRKLARIR